MNSGKENGKFIVSLDFELMWGVRDLVSIKTYGNHILGVHEAIPRLLSYFQEYGIRATFATVGFLFFETKRQLLENLPERKPEYKHEILSPYGNYIKERVGTDYKNDPYHFGPELIQLIKDTPGQEIGTHTFSHYYCLEEGQTIDDFRNDLQIACAVAASRGITITSIIFPRNQFNNDYLEVCKEAGIIAYRNNEDLWVYNARPGEKDNLLRRACRLIDAYVNLTGHHCYTDKYLAGNFPVNIPSSRFLRPYSYKLRMLESLRLRRIKKSMTHAAKHNLMYHLWWHPHNFGINQSQNFSFLSKILVHYQLLNKKYGFKSYTMTTLARELVISERTKTEAHLI